MIPPLKNFTQKARDGIRQAHELAIERGQNHVNPNHLLAALVLQDESLLISILDNLKIDTVLFSEAILDSIETDETIEMISPSLQMYLSPELAQVIEHSVRIASALKEKHVGVEHLFLALMDVKSEAQISIRDFEIKKDDVVKILAELKRNPESTKDNPKVFKALKKFTVSLVDKAKENKIDPVIGRDEEISRIVQILSRRTKNNPILIGEAGVGKTAIIEGLANRISQGDVPESLKNKDIVSLDLGLLIAGTKYRGEFEDRLKKIIKDVKESNGKIILFIDEIHTIAGAGASEGSLDASNILKPALARGEIRTVGATTIKEYQKYIEKDAALTRRFQPVVVAEPSLEDAIAIMRGLKEKYELYHGVNITDDAVLASVELSSRYISDRFLPDKAVDLIDEASSQLKISLENMPPELEQSRRKIMRFEIEKEALLKEKAQNTKTKNRIKKIDTEIANLRAETSELELKWKNEKETINSIKEIKSQLESLRQDAEAAEFRSDLARVAEIRYGEIPALDTELKIKDKRLKRLQSSRRILKEEIDAEDIASVVSKWTGIPVSRMLEEEIKKLSRMEDVLKEKIIGQDDAVERISDTIRRSRAGVSDPNRPIGSFIFLGPTGVGKTELTKALAEFVFNDKKSLVRIDMSEFMEKHSVSKLIGAPPGYVGHDDNATITDIVRHKPYSVILFDEIEKAHPEVFNILLQVLDNGRLTDSKGRTVNFKNTVIILTSNIGAEHIDKMESIGFDEGESNNKKKYSDAKQKVEKALKDHFRPEFLNRLDDIIVFDILNEKAIEKIVELQLKEIEERLSEKNIKLKPNKTVIKYLAEEGYDPHYGARPIRRLIQKKILNQLAKLIISQNISEGSVVNISVKNKEFVFSTKKGKTSKTYKDKDLKAKALA